MVNVLWSRSNKEKTLLKEIIDEIFEKASLQALEEIKNFLKLGMTAAKRYKTILKSIASR